MKRPQAVSYKQTHTPIPETLEFPRHTQTCSCSGGFGELLKGLVPRHPTVPISLPSLFSSLINPLIPAQVSLNGPMGSLQSNRKDLALCTGVNLLHLLGAMQYLLAGSPHSTLTHLSSGLHLPLSLDFEATFFR